MFSNGFVIYFMLINEIDRARNINMTVLTILLTEKKTFRQNELTVAYVYMYWNTFSDANDIRARYIVCPHMYLYVLVIIRNIILKQNSLIINIIFKIVLRDMTASKASSFCEISPDIHTLDSKLKVFIFVKILVKNKVYMY